MDAEQIKTITTAIAEIVAASASLNAMLILELDNRGHLDKSEFSSLLQAHIKDLTDHPHALAENSSRYDLRMLEGVRGFLSGHSASGLDATRD